MPTHKWLEHHRISFKNAFAGVKYTFLTQPNLRIHFAVALLVLLGGFYFNLSSFEWLLILIAIMWVIVSEMINTAIESVVDLITKDYAKEAKVAKDVAAGMVLLGAAAAVIIGLVVFGPYLRAVLLLTLGLGG